MKILLNLWEKTPLWTGFYYFVVCPAQLDLMLFPHHSLTIFTYKIGSAVLLFCYHLKLNTLALKHIPQEPFWKRWQNLKTFLRCYNPVRKWLMQKEVLRSLKLKICIPHHRRCLIGYWLVISGNIKGALQLQQTGFFLGQKNGDCKSRTEVVFLKILVPKDLSDIVVFVKISKINRILCINGKAKWPLWVFNSKYFLLSELSDTITTTTCTLSCTILHEHEFGHDFVQHLSNSGYMSSSL